MSTPKKDFCYHNYKNAIAIGKVDHMCPKCLQMLDPFEWFFMNSFEFVDVSSKKTKKELEKRDGETSKKVLKSIKENEKYLY